MQRAANQVDRGVRESILRKAKAIKRRGDAEKLAKGWSRDEDGRLIPPGWVRAAP